MKIRILTVGSRGDVQPFVALAQGLQAVGYDVGIVTFEGFADFVEDRGIKHFPVTPLTTTLTESEAWKAWQERSGENVLAHAKNFVEIARTSSDAMAQIYAEYLEACQDADAIISSISGMAGPHIAEVLNIPHFWGLLQPLSRTRSFPHFLTPSTIYTTTYSNPLTYYCAEQAIWHLFRRALNDIRHNKLGQKRLFGPGPYGLLGDTSYPVLYGFSPTVLPKPADWPSTVHVTGYWQLNDVLQPSLPPATQDFINRHGDIIYVGWSAMRLTNAERFLNLVIEAVARLGLHAVVLTNREQSDFPSTIHAIGGVDLQRLFPQMSAVMHHGGAGTSGAALSAGTPSICVPSFFDQPFWSRRLQQLGAAPTPIIESKASVEQIQRAIAQTLEKPMQEQAQRLGAALQRENGVISAVTIINQYLRQDLGAKIIVGREHG